MNTALLRHFVRQDLVDRHAASALGAGWTLLLPLANILIFTLVFSQIMGMRLQALGLEYLGSYSYSVYLVVGLLAWNCFSATVARTTQLFQDKSALITRVNMPLFSLPLFIVISETVIYIISMSIFAVFLLLIDFQWSVQWLWLPVIIAVQQLLAYGLGLTFAMLSVFLRDIKEAVSVLLQLWFWMTPIVYVIAIIPEGFTALFRWNPLFHTTNALRDSLILGTTPNLPVLAGLAVSGGLLLLAAVALGRRLESDIRDLV